MNPQQLYAVITHGFTRATCQHCHWPAETSPEPLLVTGGAGKDCLRLLTLCSACWRRTVSYHRIAARRGER